MAEPERNKHPDDGPNLYADALLAEFREAPHNTEAEQTLLGCLMVHNDALYKVQDFLKPEHFWEGLHGRIYEAILRMVAAGRRATPITLKTTFEHEASIGGLTVPQYLGRLCKSATALMFVEDYGKTIYDLFCRREMAEIARQLLHRAQTDPIDTKPDALIEEVEQGLARLAERGNSQASLYTMAGALTESIDMIANAYRRDGGYAGLPTGFVDLDARIGGLAPTDLIVVAGRPSMGKTALAANIAMYVARRHLDTGADGETRGGSVAFFSHEMSAEQLVTRELAIQSYVTAHRMRCGRISSEEFDRIVEVSQELQNLPLYIDQAGGLTVQQVCARARRLKMQKQIVLIVVDYLQLLKGSDRRRDGRTVEVSEITNALKALAKELSVPVLAVSQLSREVEKRDDKRPQLSDLRDSGSIEQDADVVLFVFREEYYLEKRQPKENTAAHVEWQTAMEGCAGKAEIIIGKSRHGPTGTVTLQFDAAFTRFVNLASERHLPGRTP